MSALASQITSLTIVYSTVDSDADQRKHQSSASLAPKREYVSSSIKGMQGAVSIRKTVLQGMAIPMLKIRRPNGRLIFNMEIAIRR